jgi:hypothetical protein
MPDTPPTPLALFLAEHDVPCPNPKCGFNLRGLTTATCPECKEPLSLAVCRPDVLWHMRKWLIGVAVFGLFANSAALIVTLLEGSVSLTYFGSIAPRRLITGGVSFAIAACLAGALLRFALASSRSDPQALPRFMKSLLWTMFVQFLFLIVQTARVLF